MPATYSYYLYTASDSTVYRVYLLDAIAVAMGFALDTASHPYLPFDVSPRFALGETVVGSAITRLALMAPTASALAPLIGTDITLEGSTYRVIACYGESIGANPFPGIFGKIGPPGPSGGSPWHTSRIWESNQTFSPPNSISAVLSFDSPSTYIAVAQLYCTANTAGSPIQLYWQCSDASATLIAGRSFVPLAITTPVCVILAALVTTTIANATLSLQANENSNSFSIAARAGNPYDSLSGLFAARLG